MSPPSSQSPRGNILDSNVGGASAPRVTRAQDPSGSNGTPVPTITFASDAYPRRSDREREREREAIAGSPRDALRARRGSGGAAAGGLSEVERMQRERDEENRERQRAQDIDSALSMSRARSGSVAIGSAPDPHPPMLKRSSHSHGMYTTANMLDESPFPMLSEQEEEDMHHARQMSFGHAEEGDEDEGYHVRDGGGSDGRGGSGSEDERDESPRHRLGSSMGRYGTSVNDDAAAMGMGGGGRLSASDMHMHDAEGRRSMHYGSHGADSRGQRASPHIRPSQAIMMGGMGPMRNTFDFEPMEEFAVKEREELGLDRKMSNTGPLQIGSSGGSFGGRSKEALDAMRDGEAGQETDLLGDLGNTTRKDTVPMGPGSMASSFQDRTVDAESTLAASPGQVTANGETEHFIRRRNRKLSQSNPVPHARRQAKLALFEGFGGANADAAGPDTSFTLDRTATRNGQAERAAITTKASKFPKNLITGSNYSDYPEPSVPALAASNRERPYRFSFYSNALPATIHARNLCELPSENQSFSDLFAGKGGIGTDGDELNNGGLPQRRKSMHAPDSDAGSIAPPRTSGTNTPTHNGDGIQGNPKQSLLAKAAVANANGQPGGGGDDDTPAKSASPDPEASTWWLDVLSPTDDEMRMFSRVFGIHPLTTEDILLEETREKIELFRNYYLVCFRSFDQDPYSQTYLQPLNMYIIVFREGTLSFHFRGTSHPQNVRRRIKSLKDYISVTSDWISYALIDDITDAFGPLIQGIEYEVDGIDELVLIIKDAEQSDMLRRIGTCRKKVMGLLRLMGNKADVVKGLAKRCNENWSVAPKSDIGLYLSDIQDHLITMTQNLNHYEKILSRSHSNYLAQISIEMTDANNQINDVLSKLTALGTVLIPMNLVTGLWGMNVHVPGQDVVEGYVWFGSILGGLALFAIVGAWITIRIFVRN